jgi:hypothetical protein
MQKNLVISIFFLISALSVLDASGGFGGGVGQITQANDREKFHLGKAVYNMEIELPEKNTALETFQSERLEYLQGSLPNPEKKRINLPELAGRLTSIQLEALEYFISIRFNVKLETNPK